MRQLDWCRIWNRGIILARFQPTHFHMLGELVDLFIWRLCLVFCASETSRVFFYHSIPVHGWQCRSYSVYNYVIGNLFQGWNFWYCHWGVFFNPVLWPFPFLGQPWPRLNISVVFLLRGASSNLSAMLAWAIITFIPCLWLNCDILFWSVSVMLVCACWQL